MRIVIGAIIGAVVGFGIGYSVKCASGVRLLTSNPIVSALSGATFGAMFAAGV